MRRCARFATSPPGGSVTLAGMRRPTTIVGLTFAVLRLHAGARRVAGACVLAMLGLAWFVGRGPRAVNPAAGEAQVHGISVISTRTGWLVAYAHWRPERGSRIHVRALAPNGALRARTVLRPARG